MSIDENLTLPRPPWKIVHGAGIWWIEDADGGTVCEAMDERALPLLFNSLDLLNAAIGHFGGDSSERLREVVARITEARP